MFKTKGDVLAFLFFVNGTGNSWVKGQLVSDPELTPRNLRKTAVWEVARHRAFCKKMYADMDQFWIKKGRKPPQHSKLPTMTARPTREVLNSLQVSPGEDYDPRTRTISSKREIYPICQYAMICNMPDDIKPDWLQAARDAVFRVAPQMKRTKEDNTWLRKAATRLRRTAR